MSAPRYGGGNWLASQPPTPFAHSADTWYPAWAADGNLYTVRARRGPVVLVVVDLCISSTAQVQQAIHPPHLLLKEILAGRQIIMGARRVPPL